jgi:Putative zinc-finger
MIQGSGKASAMSPCDRLIQAQRHHDGELSPAERADFECHAAQCSQCTRELQELQRLSAGIKSAFASGPLTADAVARLSGRARDEAEAAVLIRLAVSGMSAAAAILLLCSVMLWQPWRQSPPTARTDLTFESLAVIPPNEDLSEAGDESRLALWIVADLSRANGHD